MKKGLLCAVILLLAGCSLNGNVSASGGSGGMGVGIGLETGIRF